MDSPAEQLGSGIAVLAEDEPSWSDGPFQVQGVALPEDVTMQAANEESLDSDEDVRTYYPAETVEEAAALFEGRKIVDGREHDLNSVLENPSQPLPETIVGEITSARYKPGVGVVYEGEVDDPDIAKLIERDRVEVSPTVFRELGDEVDDNTFEAQEVAHVRDLSVVAEGAGDGNSIRPAAAAMTAEALRQEFSDDGVDDGSEARQGDDGTRESPSKEQGPTTDNNLTETMSEEPEPTEAEQRLLDLVDDPEAAIETLQEIQELEEPCIMESNEYETHCERVEVLEELFDEKLTEQKGLREATVEAMSFEAKASEFEDEEGELNAEVLVQEPETGEPEKDENVDEKAEVLMEEMGFDDRDEAIEVLETRLQNYENAGWENQADDVRNQLQELGEEVEA